MRRKRRRRTWIAPGRSGLQEETGLISSSLSVRQGATVSRESDGERRSGEKGRGGGGGKNRCEKKRGKDRGREEQIGERGEDGGEEGRTGGEERKTAFGKKRMKEGESTNH